MSKYPSYSAIRGRAIGNVYEVLWSCGGGDPIISYVVANSVAEASDAISTDPAVIEQVRLVSYVLDGRK